MNTKQTEALKLALEALQEINKLSIGENAICLPAEIDGAMDALRERLAQPSKPLTDAQIGAVAADIWGSVLIAPQSYQAFARAIEAAHGITKGKK